MVNRYVISVISVINVIINYNHHFFNISIFNFFYNDGTQLFNVYHDSIK